MTILIFTIFTISVLNNSTLVITVVTFGHHHCYKRSSPWSWFFSLVNITIIIIVINIIIDQHHYFQIQTISLPARQSIWVQASKTGETGGDIKTWSQIIIFVPFSTKLKDFLHYKHYPDTMVFTTHIGHCDSHNRHPDHDKLVSLFTSPANHHWTSPSWSAFWSPWSDDHPQ